MHIQHLATSDGRKEGTELEKCMSIWHTRSIMPELMQMDGITCGTGLETGKPNIPPDRRNQSGEAEERSIPELPDLLSSSWML